MPPGLIDELFRKTQRRLIWVSRKFFSLRGFRSLLFFLFYLLLIFSTFVFLELLFDLASPLRLGFWIIAALSTIFFAIRYLLPNLKRVFSPGKKDLYQISKIIGRKNSGVQDSLIDFLQIYDDQSSDTHPVFKYLSLQQLHKKFDEVNFHNIVNLGVLREPARRLLLIAVVFLLVFFILPQSVTKASLKVLYPTKSFQEPPPTTLHLINENQTVLKNEEIVLEGNYEGIRPHEMWVVMEIYPNESDEPARERLEIPLPSGKNFSYNINHVKNSFAYWFEADIGIAPFKNKPIFSNRGKVIVKDRPYIRNLQIKLEYPAYTNLSPYSPSPNDGEVSALLGTTVNVEVEANKILSEARILLSQIISGERDSSAIPLKIIENRGYGKFTVRGNGEYRISVLDQDSISNYQPVRYSVFALQDENPFVEITKPGQDLDLEDELKIPLLINLRDDFGFSKLSLKGRVIRAGSSQDTSSFEIQLPYQHLEKGKAISDYLWDLYSFYLIPEDYIEYYAEVSDNDRITGPKSAQSKTFIIRLPSVMEMMAEAEQAMDEQLERTDDIVSQSHELRKKLQEINRDMKRETELTWERKKEIEEKADSQKEALKKLEEIQENLEEMVNELDNRKMLSAETLEKYFELQKMFRDLASPELLEAMNKLREALEKADVNEIKKALQEFSFSVEEFEKSVERTYELFKQVQLEQKLDEINRLAEKITEEQKEINENLAENPDADTDQLGKKESNLARETDFLKDKIEDVQEALKEMSSAQLDDMKKAQEFLEERKISEQMRQMQRQLTSGEMQQAQQSGQNIQQQMEMLQSMLQQAQQNMAQMQKQEIMQAMQKVTQDMLKASHQQENLYQQSSRTDIASSQIKDIARKQAQMRENAVDLIKQLIEISKKTFFLSPQMNQLMASLMQNIQGSLGNLEERNLRNAAKAQRDAMADLNMAILSMQGSMNQLAQASSASGFEQFLQQLQQMSGQQGQLNQQSMSLLEQMGEGKLQLSDEAMARLAAQQEMIRQSLEQLNEAMGPQGNVLGRLDELGKEMEEVVKKLQQQQLDRKVIERQEQILSRLLDAQRSIREKEFSRKRQAEREDKVVVKSPPDLKKEIMERENKLQKELIQSLKEGYSTEYKDYIKLYYEILSRQSLEDSKF